MVGGHVAPNQPNHLIIALTAGHEPALAPDQLHPAPPTSEPGRDRQHLASMSSVLPRYWRDLGILTPGAHPDLRGAGHRARRSAPGCPAARPPGPSAVHLPGRQPPPPDPPRRAGRGPLARTRPRRHRPPAQPAAI